MNKVTFLTKTISITCLSATLLACGGGGGSSSSGSTETSDVGVVSVLPEAFAEGVERDSLVRVQFSGDIFSPSVDNSSFQLSYDDEALSGDISFFDTSTVDFSADDDLRLLSAYTASISTDVTDVSGLPLANSFEWSFITRDGIWRTQESMAEGAVDDPLIVAGEEATLWAFFHRDNLFSMQNDIFARQLQGDNNFGAAQLVSNGDGDGDVDGVAQTTVLNNGDVLVLWQEQAADATAELWYNRFDHLTEEWGSSQRFTLNNTNKTNPMIISNNVGNIFVLFERDNTLSMETDLMVMEYDTEGDQWLNETQVVNDLDLGSGEGYPSMAIDSEGNAMLVFYRDEHVWSRYYHAGTDTWENIALVSDSQAEDTQPNTQLVVDSQNNFTAVWVQESNAVSFPFIWSNRHTQGDGWGEAEPLVASERAFNPQLVIDRDDNIALIWQQDNVSGADNLIASYFEALGTSWSTPELLEQNNQPVSQARLTVDSSGNMMAIWQQNRSGNFIDSNLNVHLNPPSIWVARFDNTGEGDWLAGQAISSLGGSVDKPVITNNNSGEIVALWIRLLEGNTSIQSRYFD